MHRPVHRETDEVHENKRLISVALVTAMLKVVLHKKTTNERKLCDFESLVFCLCLITKGAVIVTCSNFISYARRNGNKQGKTSPAGDP